MPTTSVTRCLLLRRSRRDANGKPRNETLANLSALPNNAIAALRLALKGATLVDAESAFDVERSIPHGNVAAAHVMAEKLGLDICPGNTADAIAFKTAADKTRKDFGLTELVFAGDRGMITKTRIEDLRAPGGSPR